MKLFFGRLPVTACAIQALQRRGLLFAGAGLIAAGAVSAQDKPVMNWLVLDRAPAMIVEDGKPVDGTSGQRFVLTVANMPEYAHRFQVLAPARINTMLEQPDAEVCFPNFILTPERQKQFYTIPTNLSFPLSIVTRADVVAKLPKNAAGEVLPAALFDRTDLSGVIGAGRSFFALYDALLERRNPQAKITSIPPLRGGANILQMVAANRADYTIEYETTTRYLEVYDPSLKDSKLVTLPLAGHVLSPSGIVCPRNAWGYNIIRKLDAIVTKLLPDPKFQVRTHRWVSPKLTAYMNPYNDAFYSERMRTKLIFTPP